MLNAADPAGIIANGGWPFSATNGFKFNAPNFAQCSSPYVVTCNARVFTTLMYVNYRINGLNNLSFRGEFYNDMQGQRTGVKTRYYEFGVGWQHWMSPQVELRPEVSYYHSMDANAFNGNFNTVNPTGLPIAPNRDYSRGRRHGPDLALLTASPSSIASAADGFPQSAASHFRRRKFAPRVCAIENR